MEPKLGKTHLGRKGRHDEERRIAPPAHARRAVVVGARADGRGVDRGKRGGFAEGPVELRGLRAPAYGRWCVCAGMEGEMEGVRWVVKRTLEGEMRRFTFAERGSVQGQLGEDVEGGSHQYDLVVACANRRWILCVSEEGPKGEGHTCDEGQERIVRAPFGRSDARLDAARYLRLQ